MHDLRTAMEGQFANTNAAISQKDDEYLGLHRDFNMRLDKFGEEIDGGHARFRMANAQI